MPAQLLEPIPNLEYWMVRPQRRPISESRSSLHLRRCWTGLTCLPRTPPLAVLLRGRALIGPILTCSINDSPDPLLRMLAVLRWAFSKELKFIRGKVCKPYNSVLGEHFRCHYDVRPVEYQDGDHSNPPTQHLHLFVEEPEPATEPAPTKSRFGWSPFGGAPATPKEGPAKDKVSATLQIESNLAAGVSNISLNTLQHLSNPPPGREIEEDVPPGETIRVVYLVRLFYTGPFFASLTLEMHRRNRSPITPRSPRFMLLVPLAGWRPKASVGVVERPAPPY